MMISDETMMNFILEVDAIQHYSGTLGNGPKLEYRAWICLKSDGNSCNHRLNASSFFIGYPFKNEEHVHIFTVCNNNHKSFAIAVVGDYEYKLFTKLFSGKELLFLLYRFAQCNSEKKSHILNLLSISAKK